MFSSRLAALGCCICWTEGKGGKSSWLWAIGHDNDWETESPITSSTARTGLFPTDKEREAELCPSQDRLRQVTYTPCEAAVLAVELEDDQVGLPEESEMPWQMDRPGSHHRQARLHQQGFQHVCTPDCGCQMFWSNSGPGSSPSSTVHLEQITFLLCASVSPPEKWKSSYFSLTVKSVILKKK